MSKVVAALRERIRKQVGEPSIIAQPPGRVTLVNFTSLFHAPEQNETHLTVTRPVPGDITATAEYTWELGDRITGEGSGHPYDDRIDPKSPPSDDYYVKAVCQTPGVKKVKLTLAWHASISLPGGAVPLEPLIFTAETTTTAKTATARLYNPQSDGRQSGRCLRATSGAAPSLARNSGGHTELVVDEELSGPARERKAK